MQPLRRRETFGVVVSRGGRPATATRMTGDVKIEIVPGAGHLFEERGAMERVIALASDWVTAHLGQGARP